MIEYYLNKDVDQTTLAEFQQKLFEAIKADQKEFTLWISSPGGEVSCAAGFVDLILDSPIPVTTVAIGKADSGGFLILAAGAKRYASQGTRLLFHDYHGGFHGKGRDQIADAGNADYLFAAILRRLQSRTGKEPEWWFNQLLIRYNVDWWMTPEEAKEHGVIDQIGIPYAKPLPKTKWHTRLMNKLKGKK